MVIYEKSKQVINNMSTYRLHQKEEAAYRVCVEPDYDNAVRLRIDRTTFGCGHTRTSITLDRALTKDIIEMLTKALEVLPEQEQDASDTSDIDALVV